MMVVTMYRQIFFLVLGSSHVSLLVDICSPVSDVGWEGNLVNHSKWNSE